MQKLLIAAVCFIVGLWIWNEYFRAIPHLNESGVLKNFQIESIQAHEAQYTVVAKRYVSPQRAVIHQASPMVGHFNDLAYVSNIDVLLMQEKVEHPPDLAFDEVRRCYFSESALSPSDRKIAQDQMRYYSLIAENEHVANQIRQLKTGQKIMLSGDLSRVYSKTIQHEFKVGQGSSFAENCHIFRVREIRVF